MSEPADLAAKRARWRQYFEQRLTGGDAEVNVATDAAIEAARRGQDLDGIVAAGLAAAKHYRQHGRAPAPPRAATAPPAGAATPGASRTGGASGGSARRAAVGSASSGVVTGFQQRQEMVGRTYFTVWNFRLERADEQGRPLPPIPVEMRGRYFTGSVANGDTVDIGRSFRPGQLVKTSSVRNVTVGTDVKAVGRQYRALRGVALVIYLILFLCVAGIILTVIFNISSIDMPTPELPDPELPE